MKKQPQHLAVREQRQINPPLQPAVITKQHIPQIIVGH